eukprot:1161815-Pelagomonas_calceolata.AAC.10
MAGGQAAWTPRLLKTPRVAGLRRRTMNIKEHVSNSEAAVKASFQGRASFQATVRQIQALDQQVH